MSDAQESSDTSAPVSEISSREHALLVAALSSLKSGAPELDMDLFVKFGNFKTKKTALNQWALLKKKLLARPKEGEEGYKAPVPATPKKTPGRKRAKKESDEGNDLDDEGEAVKKGKTPRKTAAKNAKKGPDDGAAEDEAVAGADTGASPPSIKKPRGRPRKNAATAAFKPVKTDTFAEQAAAAAADSEHVDSVDPAEMVPAAQRQETSIPVAVDENTNMEGVLETTE
ncbi:uncharacterized protein SEPMUDRAFT_126535 [Sphaerulina musiva SO2202]|uniref:Uncharacterized protein n=1 Tax=Sphaerulina musiva (strain SO2202) TaxID=692275 RepID=N1QKC7_SPHMS|nr:uncharacterized protein SEPMUDRAFT_126535 [Sphaerulina musiva SO2202]EMF12260.1 hypothetical protein SEPMUDRAFT_126535 [Sphaerulina musiva SO2202]